MTNVKKLTLAGMFAALIALLTYFPHITTSTGYIHLGDSLIYTASILYGGIFGAATAGIGSMIADLISGYPQYAIATLIIKGIMGYMVGKMSNNREYVSVRNMMAMLVGGVIMVVGYGLFEVLIAANGQSWSVIFFGSIVTNSIQYVFGVLLGILILFTLKKTNIIKR